MTRWAPVAVVVMLLAVTALATTVSGMELTDLPTAEQTAEPKVPSASAMPSAAPEPSGTGEAGPARDPSAIPPELITWGAIACLVLVAALVIFTLWINVKDKVQLRLRALPVKAEPVASEKSAEEVRAAVEAGLDALDDNGDPRQAIIACWLRLEAAAEATGVAREVSDAPADFVRRLLAGHRVSESVLERLAALYREARYAPHVVSTGMREEARAAFGRLRGDLTGARA